MSTDNLEIMPYLPQITRTIMENDISFVSAPTGYGKTVGIPLGTAAMGLRMFISIPTKGTTISLTRFQRAIQARRGMFNPDDFVSNAYDSNVYYSDVSKIVYCTAGHIRRKLGKAYKENKMQFCDILFVDEVHNQTMDIAMILTIWRAAYTSGMKVPRLLMSSATPISVFSDLPIGYYTIEGKRLYDTYVRYLSKPVKVDSPLFNSIIVDLIKSICENTSNEVNPHIMIFLPGLGDIETLIRLTPNYPDCVKLKYYGTMTEEEEKLASSDNSFPKGIRKIVYSTNVAEASLTIVGLGYVIDTLLEKRMAMTESGGTKLIDQRISKDSAIQRAGRTGRKNEGVIFRMITKEEFDKLDQHIPSEVDTLPIYDAILELVSSGIDPYLFPAKRDKIERSMKLLSDLDIIQYYDGVMSVSEIGDFAVSYALPIRISTFLYHWIRLKLPLYQGCVIVCLIANYGPSYFTNLRKNPDLSQSENTRLSDEYKIKYFSKYQEDNVFETMISMWVDLYNTTQLTDEVKQYCNDNGLDYKKITGLIKSFNQCYNKKPPQVIGVDNIDREVNNNFSTYMNYIKLLLYATHRDKVMTHISNNKYRSVDNEEFNLYENELINKRYQYDKYVVALVVSEIGNRAGKLNRSIGLSFPINL